MNRTSIVGFLTVFISGAALGAVSLWFLGAGRGSVGSTSESSAEPAKSVSARRVSISPEKLKVIQIETALLEPTKVRQQMQVPATITLNVDRRATVSPRVPGIVRQVDVVLGQKVKAGQRLAMIESPDVGTARLLVRSHRFDLQVSKRDAEWRALITKNVELLMTDLATKPEAKTLEIKYANKPLGHDRGMLLSSYAKYELTRHEELKQLELFKKNLIGEHLIHQSQHGREGAQAEFESAMEQTRFDVLQEKRISDQKVQQAEVDLIDAVQRLRLLGVPGDDPSLDLDLNSSEIVSAQGRLSWKTWQRIRLWLLLMEPLHPEPLFRVRKWTWARRYLPWPT